MRVVQRFNGPQSKQEVYSFPPTTVERDIGAMINKYHIRVVCLQYVPIPGELGHVLVVFEEDAL